MAPQHVSPAKASLGGGGLAGGLGLLATDPGVGGLGLAGLVGLESFVPYIGAVEAVTLAALAASGAGGWAGTPCDCQPAMKTQMWCPIW